MFNFAKKTIYTSLKGAAADAQALFSVLGNKEEIIKVVADRGITKGKWDAIVEELVELVEPEDVSILQDNYFLLAKRGQESILWEKFAHYEETRAIEAKELQMDKKIGIMDALIADAFEHDIDLNDLIIHIQNYQAKHDEEEKETAETNKQEPEREEVQKEEMQKEEIQTGETQQPEPQESQKQEEPIKLEENQESDPNLESLESGMPPEENDLAHLIEKKVMGQEPQESEKIKKAI